MTFWEVVLVLFIGGVGGAFIFWLYLLFTFMKGMP